MAISYFVNNLVKKLAKLIYVVRGGATACGFSELPMELELENQWLYLSLCQHPRFWLTHIYKKMEHTTEDMFLLLTVPYTICSFVSTLILLVYVRIIANTSEADYLVH